MTSNSKKYNIGIVTTTRADYGIMQHLIKVLLQEEKLNVNLLVTGTHLLKSYGYTLDEIVADGNNFISLPIFDDNNSGSDKPVVETMANVMVVFNKYFMQNKIDLLVVLGDRFETFSIATCAYTLKIPIAHIHGGETTAGALDEAYRHCITKMSYLHFCSNTIHQNRIIRMGESPSRVFDVGALGAENILHLQPLDSNLLKEMLKIPRDRKHVLVTFHPTTMNNNTNCEMTEVLAFLEKLKGISIIISKANADSGGKAINKMIDNFVINNTNAYAFASLGVVNYLSLMKDCLAVIGNSSSGIIEAPEYSIPTINIGDRQQGRASCKTIINCPPIAEEIMNAYNFSQDVEMKKILEEHRKNKNTKRTSLLITNIILKELTEERIDLQKQFWDGD